MCIAIIKPAGSKIPSESVLDLCFDNNKDGAGFAVARNSQVEIYKGFMTLEALKAGIRIANIKAENPAIYHFRLATSGGISPGKCHPFPLSNKICDLEKTFHLSATALVHNGIFGFYDTDKGLSDTQIFIQDIAPIVDKKGLGSIKRLLGMIAYESSSKIAILQANGTINKFGEWKKGEDGLYYTNEGYKYRMIITYESEICNLHDSNMWWSKSDKGDDCLKSSEKSTTLECIKCFQQYNEDEAYQIDYTCEETGCYGDLVYILDDGRRDWSKEGY